MVATEAPPDVLARALEDDLIADPYPYLAWLRENHPVHLAPAGFYLTATHADSLTVTSRIERFRGPHPDQIPALYPLAERYRAVKLMADTIIMKNPPDHTRVRRLYSRGFSARDVAKMRADTERRCERVVDDIEEPLRDGETLDLHTRVAQRLPIQIVADLLGIPDVDRDWLFARFHAVLSTFAPGATERTLDAAETASNEVADYLAGLIEELRQMPGQGLISNWVQVHKDDPDNLSYDEMLSTMWGLVAGGVVTTAAALSNGMVAVVTYPEQTHWLRAGDAEARRFADEVFRYQSPSFVAGVPRFAVEDTELSGVPIPAGADVRTLLGSANRDPRVFPDPDRFDPGRDNRRSLALGHGIHFCLGATVATQQVAVLLRALHRRFPSLTLAGPPRWRRALPVRSIEYLPGALG